jgi:hypothetical protein
MYIQGNPFEIHNPAHWNLICRSMTAPQPVLSLSSILPPPPSLSVFISARKYPAHISKLLLFFTFLKKLRKSEIATREFRQYYVQPDHDLSFPPPFQFIIH